MPSDIARTQLQHSQAPDKVFERNNYIWPVLIGFTGAALGSMVSFLVWAAFIWAILRIALRYYPFTLERPVILFSVICALYAMTLIVPTVLQNDWTQMPLFPGFSIFLAPFFLMSRWSLTDGGRKFRLLLVGSAFGIIALVPIMLALPGEHVGRYAGVVGNPNPVALTAALFGSLGALCLMFPGRRYKILGAAAFLAMVTAVILTGRRGIWLALPFLSLLVVYGITANFQRRAFIAVIGFVVAAGLGAGIVFQDQLNARISSFQADLSRVDSPDGARSSLGNRMLLWQGAAAAIKERPLTGYGVGGRIDAIRDHLPPQKAAQLRDYTHAHNAVLSAGLDAGIWGIIAMLAVVFSPLMIVIGLVRKTQGGRPLIAASAILVTTYVFAGLTGVMFQNDITDSVFVAVACYMIVAAMTHQKQWRQKQGETS